MKVFCKKECFDQNSKLWVPGEILELKAGSPIPEYFQAEPYEEPKIVSDQMRTFSEFNALDAQKEEALLQGHEVPHEPTAAPVKKSNKRG